MNVDEKVANKVELEYSINSSANIIFQRLCTPHGLSEWFADDVNLRGNVFTFIWDDSAREAELIEKKDNKFVKFRWIDNDSYTPSSSSHFAFKLIKDDITGELTLIVTEEIDNFDDIDETTSLWNHQIGELKRVIGA
ncbi:MAG: START-like domain-containing protein [Bacteroidales bacterium]